MNIVLFGAPGVGKGTQAEILAERLAIPHISTGAIFRAAVAAGTELGREANNYMSNGLLVPDELTTRIALEALRQPDCASGFILDGFPRNRAQAAALVDALGGEGRSIEWVLYLVAPTDELVERMLQRGRADDTEETIRRRFDEYNTKTEPVLEFFRERGEVTELNGVGEIEEVHQRIMDVLSSERSTASGH